MFSFQTTAFRPWSNSWRPSSVFLSPNRRKFGSNWTGLAE